MKKTHLTAGGGIVYHIAEDEAWVLLIKRWDIWDLPKGKIDNGESIEECAKREVMEEVGISSVTLGASLGTTEHEYEEDGTHIEKTTHWFAMKSDDSSFTPQKEEGITEVAWLPLQDAQKLVGYENLKIILQRFSKNWLKGNLS